MKHTTRRSLPARFGVHAFRWAFPRQYRRAVTLRTAARYNMALEPDEGFYRDLYLRAITQAIEDSGPPQPLTILDLGCGQGRLALPLAEQGHKVTGVDLSGAAIAEARRLAEQANVPVEYLVRDVGAHLQGLPANTFDAIVCLEVLYMVDDPTALIRDMVRVLHPGGFTFLAIRPRLYYLQRSVGAHDLAAAELVAQADHGTIDGMNLSWETEPGFHRKLMDAGFRSASSRGIGILSGIPGDPQAALARPSELSDEARERLFKLEESLGPKYPECGRYMLTVARR